MDRLKNPEEEDATNTSNNDDNTHGRRRNRTKRKFHCRIPVSTRSSSSSSASTAQEGQQSDVGSSCSGQPLPITIEIKLCTSRSTASNVPPVRDDQNKTYRRTLAPLNEVEQQEFETWRQNHIHLRHSDDRLQIKESQPQPKSQLPYRTQIRIEQRPKSPSGTKNTNTTTENPEQPARFVQNVENSETVEASSTPQTPQFCQCSPGAPQFQQYTGPHFCRCQPARMYDNGIVWYAVCDNNCQRMGLQQPQTPTSTNIYVDVIPTGPEKVPTVVRDEITPRSRSLSKVKSMAEAPIFRSSDYFDLKKSQKIKAEKGKSRLLLTITERHKEHKRDKSSIAVSRGTHQPCNKNINCHPSEPTEIGKSNKCLYKISTKRGCSSVEQNNATDETYTIQESTKPSEHTTAESSSSAKGNSHLRTESMERSKFRTKKESAGSTKLSERKRAESSSNSIANSQHRTESTERPNTSSKNESPVSPAASKNYHQNCTLEDLPNRSRNRKKIFRTDMPTIKRSTNFYSQNSGQTSNRLPKYDNYRNNCSVASEALPKVSLLNESQCLESATTYIETPGARNNAIITCCEKNTQTNECESDPSKASPYYYSVEVLNEARNPPATGIPSILSKTSKYDNTGRNLKTQYRQPLSSARPHFLPNNQEAGICTCSGPSDTVIEIPSVPYIPMSSERRRSEGSPLPEVDSRNSQELSLYGEKKPKISVRSNSYSDEMVREYSFRILPEDPEALVKVVTEEQSGQHEKPNSATRNESSHSNTSAPNSVIISSVTATTHPALPSNETTPTKPPDEFRLRGGQDVDFSLRKRTPSESKNQTTSKTSNTVFTIKTRGDDFSLKFHNSNEETQCPLNDDTKSSPEQDSNMNVTSEKAEQKAGRSSVSLCRLKKHENCAFPMPAIVSSSADSSSLSSDADDVQYGPPYYGESSNLTLNHSDHNCTRSLSSVGNLSKYSKPNEDFKASINPLVIRKRMETDNDTTDRPITPTCMTCCTYQPHIGHTKANKVDRPQSYTKYRSGGRPETCKCYKAPNRDELLATTMSNIYACRTDRRPKQFIYGRVSKVERKPTAMLRNSKTNNLMRSSDDCDCVSLPLNFRQICIYLKTARLERRAELLQAIRWRLTKESSDVQLKTLKDICDYDLFKLRCRCGSRSLLEDLLWPLNTSVPNALQESTARLLNAIVSTQPGRNYVGGVSVIETLVWGETIYATPFSYNDRDHVNVQMADQLMATMMKLSLNPAQRTDMIHKGLVRWLIRHMEDVEYSATDYHQENMIALMMMLVGHPGSQELVAEKCTQVLSLLIRYMQHPGEEPAQPFQRYVRLALIDLLHSARLVSCAKQINFPQIVCQMIKKCTDSVELKELETIAELLEKTNTSLLNSLPAYQIVFKENQIFREPNIDSNDPVAATAGEGGEKLLNVKFSQPTISPVSNIFQKDFNRVQPTKTVITTNFTAFSEQNQSFFPVPRSNRIFGDAHLPAQREKSIHKPPKTRSTTPPSFPVSLPDITTKNIRSESKTALRQRSASPKKTTSNQSLDSFKNLSDHPSVTFAKEMVKTKPTKTIALSQAQQNSTAVQPSIAIATEQPRQMSQSVGQKKRKLGSKTKPVDPKPVTSTTVKAKTLELPSGHENRLETISAQSSTLTRSAPETMRENSSNSVQEEEHAETLPRTKPSSKSTSRQKTKKEAKSSVDVVKKQELNCEKCGFVKILYVVDRCTSMVNLTRARSASEQLDWRDANRSSVLSETIQVKSNVDEEKEPNISSDTVQLDTKTLTEATQTGNSSYSGIETELSSKQKTQRCPSDCLAFQDGCCETCGRPMQTSGDELRYSNEEYLDAQMNEQNAYVAQRKLSQRTEPEVQKYAQEEQMFKQYNYQDVKPKPRYYENASSAPAMQRSPDFLEKCPKSQQCGPCGRFNDEKCNFDCTARRSSDKQCGSCGRPNDRQMSAPLVSFRSSRLFDSAALPYQRAAKSLDIENFERPQADRNRWAHDPIEEFQKDFTSKPNERDRRLDHSYFEEEQKVQCCDEYQPRERPNEKPPQAKRLSRSPARPKCQKETCTQNCRRCSRRNTEPKPTCPGLPMTAQQIRSKSKSPHSERPRYPPRSVFSVDNDRSAEYLAMHQYRQGVNDEIARTNAARSFPLSNTFRKLPSRTFDRCCQSTQTPCSANEEPSQSQRRMSAPLQNTPISNQTFARSGSVDSINIDVGKRLIGDGPDRSTIPEDLRTNGTYDATRMATQNNNCHPPKDCKCCCCCQRRLDERAQAGIRGGDVERRRSMPLEERLSQIQNHAAVLAITSRTRFGSSVPDSEFNCQH